jgi:glycosyltransferase involved in cell wall biosynthesis
VKLTVTCGRKFHSDHLGAALLRRDSLDRVITANPPRTYRRHTFPSANIRFAPPYYLPGLAAHRLPGLSSLEPALSWWASRRFDHWAARHLGSPDIVLSWAWSARRTFETARARGITCVLEECGSANAHQEQLLNEEYERLGLRRRRKLPPAVIENERVECSLADVILCPSDYVARSYAIHDVPREKCLVIPYAANPALFNRPKTPPADDRLHILYVGSIGPRKGLIYLLRALQELPRDRFDCTVVGRIEPGFETVLAPFRHLFTHVASVPHNELPAYYQRASVFVLPTLDEGMAYVIMEALCSGTPVITTPHSGAEGIVKDDINGFIVPIRDSAAITTRLLALMDAPELGQRLGRAAASSAREWTWDNYADELLARLTPLASQRRPVA